MGQGIGDTQRGVHVPVAHGVLLRAFLQVRLHHAVVLSGTSLWHFVVGDIGYLAEHVGHLVLSLRHLLLQLLRGLLQGAHLLLDLLGLVLLAFLHALADLP